MTALTLSFHDMQFDVIDRNNQPWLRGSMQVARCPRDMPERAVPLTVCQSVRAQRRRIHRHHDGAGRAGHQRRQATGPHLLPARLPPAGDVGAHQNRQGIPPVGLWMSWTAKPPSPIPTPRKPSCSPNSKPSPNSSTPRPAPRRTRCTAKPSRKSGAGSRTSSESRATPICPATNSPTPSSTSTPWSCIA
jgi:hypothetical protein